MFVIDPNPAVHYKELLKLFNKSRAQSRLRAFFCRDIVLRRKAILIHSLTVSLTVTPSYITSLVTPLKPGTHGEIIL